MADPRNELRKALGESSRVRGKLALPGQLPVRIDPRAALREATRATQLAGLGLDTSYYTSSPLAVYFIIDGSRSMRPCFDEARKYVGEIGKEILQGQQSRLAVWFVHDHGSWPLEGDVEEFPVFVENDLVNTTEEVAEQLDNIILSDNRDYPEAYECVLKRLAEVLEQRRASGEFRDERSVVSFLGDSYAHGIHKYLKYKDDDGAETGIEDNGCPARVNPYNAIDAVLGLTSSFNFIGTSNTKYAQGRAKTQVQQEYIADAAERTGANCRFMHLDDVELLPPLLIATAKKLRGPQAVKAYLRQKGPEVETRVERLLSSTATGYELGKRE